MWMEPLDNGKFKYIERYTDQKTGKVKKASVTLNSDSRQAWNQATKLLNEKIAKKESVTTTKKDMTLGEAIEAYGEYKRKYWAFSTYKSYKANKSFLQRLPEYHYLLSRLTFQDIQRIIDYAQFDKKRAAGTVKMILRYIKSSCKYAEDYLEAPNNIKFNLITVTSSKNLNPLDDGYISSEKVASLVQSFHEQLNETYADFLESMLLTGMRFGELAGLTKNDWDPITSTIRIHQAVDSNNKRKISHTKTSSSVRIIESSDRLNEIFARRIAINDFTFGEESSLIFPTRNNTPLLINHMNTLLQRIDPILTTHKLRHTHISLLAEKGLPLKYIMSRVGHTQADTTLKIYTHVTDNMLKQGQKALNSLF